ncbi:MAG TPA: maltodextrin glucosidase, partial [Bacteroides sp.]|nr:maltodextrin glucosidase [Bacteroides sp.]
QVVLTNRQCIFARDCGDEKVLVAVNADSQPFYADFNAGTDKATDLISGQECCIAGGFELPPYSAYYWRVN